MKPRHSSDGSRRFLGSSPNSKGWTKRAVHFDGSPDSWTEDSTLNEPSSPTSYLNQAPKSKKSRLSQSLSDHAGNIGQRFYTTFGNPTIVHRPNLRNKPTVPFINTAPEIASLCLHEQGPAVNGNSPASSYTVSGYTTSQSPVSKASTAPTSLFSDINSANSQRSLDIRHLVQTKTASFHSCVEESLLPSIDESSPRLLTFPIQESTADVMPSVVTVEKVAAAKIYLETYFNTLYSQPASPRSLRRKHFEQKLLEVPMSDDDRQMARETWFQAESDYLRQLRTLRASSLARHEAKGVHAAGYEVVRVLGKGSFGIVRLVTEKVQDKVSHLDGCPILHVTEPKPTFPTNSPSRRLDPPDVRQVYAMKVIRKSEMLRNCQEGHLRAERDFLVASEGSQWVVPLLAAFQDNTNLYLVMEYMIGGDFLGLLLREDVLDENIAK